MARKNRTPEENARREKIRELLQMANIGSMDDIQMFKETIAEFMENGLEAELDEPGLQRYGQEQGYPQPEWIAPPTIWRRGSPVPGPERGINPRC